MKVTYYYSACVLIETPDVSILCDPWFTEGAYDGSWYHFPPFHNAIRKIPKVDYIWISHIHPDHYDHKFLKEYLKKYPETKIFISDFKNNILHFEMEHHGIPHQIKSKISKGSTLIYCVPNESIPSDIDSALVVIHGTHSIVNLNDNMYSTKHISKIKKLCPSPTIGLLGYMGAGAYPQTYFNDHKKLTIKANEKKENMFERYRKMRNELDPKISMPFAGQYVLGGKLRYLNKYRGVPDATEVPLFDPKAIVLNTFGSIDTKTLKPVGARKKPYSGLEKYSATLKNKLMDYEKFFPSKIDFRLDELLPKAYEEARAHSHCKTDYYFCIKLEKKWFYMNANKTKNESGFTNKVTHLIPRSEITINHSYLFGILTHIFHWNNAQIGSQYRVNRVPDIFNRSAEAFLNFFQI